MKIQAWVAREIKTDVKTTHRRRGKVKSKSRGVPKSGRTLVVRTLTVKCCWAAGAIFHLRFYVFTLAVRSSF